MLNETLLESPEDLWEVLALKRVMRRCTSLDDNKFSQRS